MKSISRLFQIVVITLLKFYQLVMSPIMTLWGAQCRFYPSCSNYGVEAIKKHGLFEGGLLVSKRVCRCHPFNLGGHDPVPLKTIK